MGGDITGKMLVPIVATAGAATVAAVRPEGEVDATALPALRKRIADAGYYAYAVTPDEMAAIRRPGPNGRRDLPPAYALTLERWLTLAEDRLAAPGSSAYWPPATTIRASSMTCCGASRRVVNPDGGWSTCRAASP